MKKRLFTVAVILALCLALLSATALAADEHSDHTDWTALTENVLTSKNYELDSGQYYLSEEITTNTQLVISGTVTLCLFDQTYQYSGSEGAAILVTQNGTLTVCCCEQEFGMDKGQINSGIGSGGAILNEGTLVVSGGQIISNTEDVAAILNEGNLTVSGGSIAGSAQDGTNGMSRKTAYGIYNAQGAELTISGVPSISGSAPGPINNPTGPQVDILTYDEIDVSNYDVNEWLEQLLDMGYAPSYGIGFYGAAGETILSGIDDSTHEMIEWIFTLVYPENAETVYDSGKGTLSLAVGSSLRYCEQTVQSGKYYQVMEYEDTSYPGIIASVLQAGSDSDYDIYWDEDSKTLTLHTIEAQAHRDYFSQALFSADCKSLTVQLIGDSSITVVSPVTFDAEETCAIQNTGNIVLKNADGQTGTLSMNLDLSGNTEEMTAVAAGGDVNNQTSLTIRSKANTFSAAAITGIKSAGFTNRGSLTVDVQNTAASVIAVSSAAAFSNAGKVDIDLLTQSAAGSAGNYAAGIAAPAFTNCGSINIDISTDGVAQGIYGTDAMGWVNEGDGILEITVGTSGSAAGSLGGTPLAGVYWTGDDDSSFENHGTLTVSAKRSAQSGSYPSSWPAWQFFDTIGVGLNCGSAAFSNTGTMNLQAENGCSAGLYLFCGDEGIVMNNTGRMDITATTMGGENVRAVGAFAMMINDDEAVGVLPLTISGGSVKVNARPASGYEANVMEDGCMALCLAQAFPVDSAPEGELERLQQITLNGLSIAGEDGGIVTGPHSITFPSGNIYTGFINTIGSGDTAASDVIILSTIPGSVTISGVAQVGSALTAVTDGLPDGLVVAYQWQVGDSAAGPFVNIEGATDSTYIPTGSQLNKYLRVMVSPVGDTHAGTLTAVTAQVTEIPFIGHSIAVVTDGNGTAAVNPNAAKGGETVTITATPKECYKVGTITVTSILGENVPVTGNTFIMPDCSVTVKVTFVKADRVNPFTDVAENSWYYEGVMYVYENGLMNGTGDGTTFSPAMNLNRAMLMTILARMDGVDTTGGDTWYSKGLEWAVENGISDGTNPDADITREQMVTMLYRYVGSPAVSGDLSAFSDGDSTSDWAKDAVIWVVQKGLLQGNDGKLNPTGTATRMEVATILMRFCENVLDK